MLVGETTVNDAAAVPPKLTAVVPVKFVPVMVTVVPLIADVGVNEVMVGKSVLFLKITTAPVEIIVTAISGFLSPLRSPIASLNGALPLTKSTFCSNDINPFTEVFL